MLFGVRTAALSRVSLMLLSLSVLGGRLVQQDPLQLGPAGQPLGMGGLPGAYVEEGGGDRVEGQAVQLGPGEPVDGELSGSAVRWRVVFQSTIS
ncbi:hypothetical protein SMICM304S_10644 [Streptomyces microflavus]